MRWAEKSMVWVDESIVLPERIWNADAGVHDLPPGISISTTHAGQSREPWGILAFISEA